MNEIKHTPGPWASTAKIARDGYEVFAIQSGDVTICSVEAPDAGRYHVPNHHLVKKANADLIAAAPDMLMVLEMLAADADAGKVMIPSGLRLSIDAALIKAGRKEAPEPLRVVTIAGVDRDPPRYCSFCFEADCGGECSGDGLMGG